MLATSFTTFLWSLIVIFFMVVYFMMLFSVIDVFRRHDASGGKKALWLIFIQSAPLVGLLAYLIVNGQGIADASRRTSRSRGAVRPVRSDRRRRVRRPDRQGEGASTPARSRRPSSTRSRRRRSLSRSPRAPRVVL